MCAMGNEGGTQNAFDVVDSPLSNMFVLNCFMMDSGDLLNGGGKRLETNLVKGCRKGKYLGQI